MYTKGILSSPVSLPLPAPPLFTSPLVAGPLSTGLQGINPQKAEMDSVAEEEGKEVNVPVSMTATPIL